MPPNAAIAPSPYRQGFYDGLRPDPKLTVSEWADKHRRLSARASSEPGPWRTSRAPYLREPMDLLSSSSPVERVIVMKGSQLGFTEAGNNLAGYIIHHSPGPTLIVLPTLAIAKRNSRQRIGPLIEDCPELSERVRPARARDSGNTVMSKDFPGGVLALTGANSAVGLRSMPVRFLFLDEIDAYPESADDEGDPITLAEARTRTFTRRKIYLVSTPTISGRSRIEMEYEASDQRRYYVPCPACDEFQTLKLAQLRWEKAQPETARYVCEHCGTLLGDEHKTAMLAAGEWRAENPGPNKPAGFHISALYSPVGWLSWAEIAEAWDKAQGNQQLLQSFINTILGETWKEKGEAPEWQRLYDRAEDFKIGSVPAGALFLTAGIDVQHDRLEVFVWGWGRGLESWLVDHRVLHGDPYGAEVWASLSQVVSETWPHECGIDLPLTKVAIDSGYATTQVYAWVKTQHPGRVIAVKGVDRGSAGIGSPKSVSVAPRPGAKRKRHGGTVYPVVGSIFKSELYGYLRLEAPTRESGDPFPAGYVHLPKFPDEVFKQLTSEQLVTRIVKFQRRTEWEKIRDRNEALDCRVYARAAAAVHGIERFRERHWAALEAHLDALPRPKPIRRSDTESPNNGQSAGRSTQRAGGSWLGPRRSSWLKR